MITLSELLKQQTMGPSFTDILGQVALVAVYITILLGCVALCIWLVKKILHMMKAW